jgi:hypothetical protein
METPAERSSLEEAPAELPQSEVPRGWLAVLCDGLLNLFGSTEWDWTMWRGE